MNLFIFAAIGAVPGAFDRIVFGGLTGLLIIIFTNKMI